MATSRPARALDDELLSDADCAAIDRALSEPGITLSADELAALLATCTVSCPRHPRDSDIGAVLGGEV